MSCEATPTTHQWHWSYLLRLRRRDAMSPKHSFLVELEELLRRSSVLWEKSISIRRPLFLRNLF
ncbi:MAG: hypothetical protein QXH42_05265 [Thermoplasmata archaeon]